MQFAGIDGVVLLFVAYRHGAVSEDGREDLPAHREHAAGMWTTAATFYGLAVVDFPVRGAGL